MLRPPAHVALQAAPRWDKNAGHEWTKRQDRGKNLRHRGHKAGTPLAAQPFGGPPRALRTPQIAPNENQQAPSVLSCPPPSRAARDAAASDSASDPLDRPPAHPPPALRTRRPAPRPCASAPRVGRGEARRGAFMRSRLVLRSRLCAGGDLFQVWVGQGEARRGAESRDFGLSRNQRLATRRRGQRGGGRRPPSRRFPPGLTAAVEIGASAPWPSAADDYVEPCAWDTVT
jgi:hypothetical protein